MGFFDELAMELGIPVWTIIILIIWILVWKGLALWKSARKNQPIWFIVFLLIHTIGILEILYYYLFSEIKLDEKKKKTIRKKSKPKTTRSSNQRVSKKSQVKKTSKNKRKKASPGKLPELKLPITEN